MSIVDHFYNITVILLMHDTCLTLLLIEENSLIESLELLIGSQLNFLFGFPLHLFLFVVSIINVYNTYCMPKHVSPLLNILPFRLLRTANKNAT